MEFFEYNLGEKSESEVAHYYPRKVQADLYRKVNPEKYWAITKDKFASYCELKEFYRREVCAYNPCPNEYVRAYYDNYDWKSEIVHFISKHSDYIIKPLAGSIGYGVTVIHDNNVDIDPEQKLRLFIADYPEGFILEELIKQHSSLSRFHPDSVNTIRIITFNWMACRKEVEAKFPYLRVGRKGSVIDNIDSGGIGVIIGESGRMLFATDSDGVLYDEHPDSHVMFDGEIPYWNELIDTAIQVANAIPDLKIAGLDFALDIHNKWTLVEINVEPHIGIYQHAANHGVREYMERFATGCGIH